MGVVYKLKREVVDFIIDRKKSDSKLSCRSLVDIVQSQFQVRVSKSAINQIIKDAQLSNPVGRIPASDKKIKKFQIPVERKQQLFASLPIVSPQLTAHPNAVQEPPPPIPNQKPPIVQTKQNTSDGLGAFFLKAAQADLSEKALLEKILEKIMESHSKDLKTLSDAVLVAPVFGLNNWHDLEHYKGSGFWTLCGAKGKDNLKPLQDLAEKIKAVDNLPFLIETEISQLFVQANKIKITLEDETEIALSARSQSFLNVNEPSRESLPLARLIRRTIAQFISNSQWIILHHSESDLSSPLLKCLASFEGKGGRMSKLEIFDQNGQQFTQFDIFPNKIRRFVLLGQKKVKLFEKELKTIEFKQLRDQNNVASSLRVGETVINLKAHFSNFQECALKLFFINTLESKSEHFWILTNIESSLEDVFPFLWEKASETRMDNLEGSFPVDFGSLYQKNVKNDQKTEILSLFEQGQAIVGVLNEYSKRLFFPENCQKFTFSQMVEHFYSLAGTLEAKAGIWQLELHSPAQYPYQKALEYAIHRFNQLALKSEDGRPIKVCLKPAAS